MRRLIACLLVAALLAPGNGVWGCVNTRYSRDEERQLTGDVVKLIMGQFAHHGDHFYGLELEKTAKEIEADPANVEARNDRAVAYLKLEEYAKAERELLEIEKSHPGRYRTHANLGVLYKKMGRLPEAAASVRRSLEIQPEGHLGLGDYYVRMIEWLNDRTNSPLDKRWVGNPEDGLKVQPETNFLGIAYLDGWSATATNALVNREHLKTLIKADRSFADAVMVLGDVLAHTGEKELAFRAYVRARDDLNHPALTAIRQRINEIYAEWTKEAGTHSGHIVLPKQRLFAQLHMESKQAEIWMEDFASTETELLSAGKNPDFDAVKAEMKASRIAEPRYIFAGVVKGTRAQRNDPFNWFAVFIGLSVVAVILSIGLLLIRAVYRWMRDSWFDGPSRAGSN